MAYCPKDGTEMELVSQDLENSIAEYRCKVCGMYMTYDLADDTYRIIPPEEYEELEISKGGTP